jgi:hypothetical protein
MAKGYMLKETVGFVTKYLQEFQHVSRRVWDADKEGVFGVSSCYNEPNPTTLSFVFGSAMGRQG